jgi:hypothetical protein
MAIVPSATVTTRTTLQLDPIPLIGMVTRSSGDLVDHILSIEIRGDLQACGELLLLELVVEMLQLLLSLALLAVGFRQLFVLLLELLLFFMHGWVKVSAQQKHEQELPTIELAAHGVDLAIGVVDDAIHLIAQGLVFLCETPREILLVHTRTRQRYIYISRDEHTSPGWSGNCRSSKHDQHTRE